MNLALCFLRRFPFLYRGLYVMGVSFHGGWGRIKAAELLPHSCSGKTTAYNCGNTKGASGGTVRLPLYQSQYDYWLIIHNVILTHTYMVIKWSSSIFCNESMARSLRLSCDLVSLTPLALATSSHVGRQLM